MVMEVVHEDAGEGSMQCTNHPYKNSTPGGICAFCLQEKLGKLVTSSYPAAVFPSTSSSPSPSAAAGGGPSGGDGSSAIQNGGNDCSYHGYYNTRKSRLPFVFKRSKSTAISRRGINFLNVNYGGDYSPSRRGFWSFLYSSKQKKSEKNVKDLNLKLNGGGIRARREEREDMGEEREDLGVEENVGPIDRKVSRSRSVGCGSRSFSGDIFERISTGLGDCTLRRVESQREGRLKMDKNGEDCITERVKCGGIFRGFMVNSSSSYFITSSVVESGKSLGHLSHGRSKSWGWALASPMRAFAKSSAVKKNASPNLAAVPSLLAVSG